MADPRAALSPAGRRREGVVPYEPGEGGVGGGGRGGDLNGVGVREVGLARCHQVSGHSLQSRRERDAQL